MKEKRLWSNGPMYIAAKHMPLTTDTILLADFASVGREEKGADLGCASGLLMLLLLWREESLRMTGLELQPDAVRRAEENFRLNGMQARAELLCGDLRESAKSMPNGGFDFVIANPPYYDAKRGTLPQDPDQAAARSGICMSVSELCRAASRLCRSGGRVYFCYRPEQMLTLLEEMRGRHLEPKRMRFVHHSLDAEAFLVLVEGRKDGKPGLRLEKPLLIRNEDGTETEEYRAACHMN